MVDEVAARKLWATSAAAAVYAPVSSSIRFRLPKKKRQSFRWFESCKSGLPEEVDDFDCVKTSLIVGHNNTVIGPCNGRDNRIRCTSAAGHVSLSHQLAPDERCLFVERKYAARKESAWPLMPANQASRATRFLPADLSRIPRCISAMVGDAMNKPESTRSAIQVNSDDDGSGFIMLPRTFVSSRYRIIARSLDLLRVNLKFGVLLQRGASGAEPQGYHLF